MLQEFRACEKDFGKAMAFIEKDVDGSPSLNRPQSCATPEWCHNGGKMNIAVKDVPQELHQRL